MNTGEKVRLSIERLFHHIKIARKKGRVGQWRVVCLRLKVEEAENKTYGLWTDFEKLIYSINLSNFWRGK